MFTHSLRTVFAAAVIAVAVLSSSIQADIVYSANANYQGGTVEAAISGVNPVFLVHTPPYSNADTIWNVRSSSDHGRVNGYTQATNVQANLATPMSTASTVRFQTDDLVFSSPNSDLITTNLNFEVLGGFWLATCCDANHTYGRIDVEIGIGSNVFTGFQMWNLNDEGTYIGSLGGMFDDSLNYGSFAENLMTDDFTVQPNTPLDFWMEVTVSSQADVRAYSSGLVQGNLSLERGIPVFGNLEPGVTANSWEARLIDNYYYGSVPEPGSVSLLFAGLILVAGGRNRRRRT